MTESNTSIHRETEKILLSHSWILSLDVAHYSSVFYHVIRNCHTPFSYRAAHSVHFIDKLIEKKRRPHAHIRTQSPTTPLPFLDTRTYFLKATPSISSPSSRSRDLRCRRRSRYINNTIIMMFYTHFSTPCSVVLPFCTI